MILFEVPFGAYSVGTTERSTTIAPYSRSATRIASAEALRSPFRLRSRMSAVTFDRSRIRAPAGSDLGLPTPSVTEAGWT